VLNAPERPNVHQKRDEQCGKPGQWFEYTDSLFAPTFDAAPKIGSKLAIHADDDVARLHQIAFWVFLRRENSRTLVKQVTNPKQRFPDPIRSFPTFSIERRVTQITENGFS